MWGYGGKISQKFTFDEQIFKKKNIAAPTQKIIPMKINNFFEKISLKNIITLKMEF